MHKEIVTMAFKKVEKELKRDLGISPSLTNCANQLSILIFETNKFSYGEKSLRKLYKLALDSTEEEIEVKQPQVVSGLCKFLGYKNYKDFVFKNHLSQNEEEEEEGAICVISHLNSKKKIKLNSYQEKVEDNSFNIIISINVTSVLGFLIVMM